MTIFAALAGVDTPTVCNAMIVLDPSLRGKNYTLDSVIPANADMASFTGHALTAKIVSSRILPLRIASLSHEFRQVTP